jgi:hypothetical protein
MRLRLNWRVAALAGALLWGACSKEPAPAQEPAAPEAAQAPKPAAAPSAEPGEDTAETPSQEESQAAAPSGGSAQPEFKLGQRREEVMRLFGDCAERRVFEPPGPGKLYVEIYQAKDDAACRQRLGERQFMIRGGLLHQITPGLIPPEPPPQEPPEGS